MAIVSDNILRPAIAAVAVLIAGFSLLHSVSAQLPASITDEIKRINLLETERGAVRKLLTPGSFTVHTGEKSDVFFKESYNIVVEYSTGECTGTKDIEDNLFLGSDVWNVALDRVVNISIEPKARPDLRDLGVDISKFKKERVYPDRDVFDIYFNKAKGMAITVAGDRVESIEFFPGERDHSLLCESDVVRRHYRTNKWRLRRGPKLYCVLINQPANVMEVRVNPINGDSRELEVLVEASDPENDVLTYIFKVSGGSVNNHGSRAVWNLKGEKPGSYTITAAVDDGVGPRGKFVSKSVVID